MMEVVDTHIEKHGFRIVLEKQVCDYYLSVVCAVNFIFLETFLGCGLWCMACQVVEKAFSIVMKLLFHELLDCSSAGRELSTDCLGSNLK